MTGAAPDDDPDAEAVEEAIMLMPAAFLVLFADSGSAWIGTLTVFLGESLATTNKRESKQSAGANAISDCRLLQPPNK
jgi:hypothetical protein